MNPLTGFVTSSSGQRFAAQDLVDQLRRYRGRLTRRELCAAIGWNPNDKVDMNAVNRLCTRWDIASAPNSNGRN